MTMLVLFSKRHSSPSNLILLGLFTLLEAIGLGAAVAFVNTLILLEALILTGLVFIGLTLFTLRKSLAMVFSPNERSNLNRARS